MRLYKGFTLVEMLVIMAIIGVLAGLILPALSSARESARKSECMNNLKQIGDSLTIYHNSSAEYYPSYANYGCGGPARDPYGAGAARYAIEYQNANDYDRLSSRHLVLAYASGHGASYYAEGKRNFIATGLGLLLKQGALDQGGVFHCPSMKGRWNTRYGHNSGGWTDHAYAYEAALWKRLGALAPGAAIESGNGKWLEPHPSSSGERAVALLGTYSYRLQPYFWTGGSPGGQATLANTKPAQRAQYLCPPFKTHRQIGGRAIASDTFDFGLDADWGGKGLGAYGHKDGYNVLYGDGHAKWYTDDKQSIIYWNHPSMGQSFDDLTISSPAAQQVWHVFDVAGGVDAD